MAGTPLAPGDWSVTVPLMMIDVPAGTPGLLTNSPKEKNYFDDCWKKGKSLKLAGRKNT